MEEKFFEFYNNRTPEKGDLLISEPLMLDNNFSRTVVLLCEHNESGTFGFVLNRPTELTVSQIMEDFDHSANPVYIGGPVQQDTLHYIHHVPELLADGREIKNGIYWGGNFEQLKFHLESKEIKQDDIKFFVGYSGWDEGQLADELKVNSWILSKNADIGQIFHTEPDKLWKDTLKKMGGKYRMFSNYPVDPRLN